MRTSLADCIAPLIEQSCRCWNAQDYRGLRDLWDGGEPEPWCVAEEIEQPIIGWPAIEAYWQTNLGLLERIDVRYGNLRVKQVGAGLALAIYGLRFSPKHVGPGPGLAGESRVTALLRERGKAWRFCHLAEAPLSPAAYMRQFFQRNGVAEGS